MDKVRRNKREKAIKRIRAKRGARNHELLIFRSNRHIYANVIECLSGKTLFSCSTLDVELGVDVKSCSKQAASVVGSAIAKKCVENKIVPFVNRASYKFHGRVKSLVDSAMDVIVQVI